MRSAITSRPVYPVEEYEKLLRGEDEKPTRSYATLFIAGVAGGLLAGAALWGLA